MSDDTISDLKAMIAVGAFIGLGTGTGKPAVITKWVTRVWVQCLILAHHGILHTHTVVSRVCMGIIILR